MNKRADINELLLKIFVFVVIYQIITHWNATQEIANIVPQQVNNEMDYLAESYWSKYMCQKNNSFYISKKPPLYSKNTLHELKEVKFSGYTDKPTPADQLNNIEATGTLSATAVVARTYDVNDRKWTEWYNGIYMGINIKKINGEWQMENQDKYKLPNCSTLPQ